MKRIANIISTRRIDQVLDMDNSGKLCSDEFCTAMKKLVRAMPESMADFPCPLCKDSRLCRNDTGTPMYYAHGSPEHDAVM